MAPPLLISRADTIFTGAVRNNIITSLLLLLLLRYFEPAVNHSLYHVNTRALPHRMTTVGREKKLRRDFCHRRNKRFFTFCNVFYSFFHAFYLKKRCQMQSMNM